MPRLNFSPMHSFSTACFIGVSARSRVQEGGGVDEATRTLVRRHCCFDALCTMLLHVCARALPHVTDRHQGPKQATSPTHQKKKSEEIEHSWQLRWVGSCLQRVVPKGSVVGIFLFPGLFLRNSQSRGHLEGTASCWWHSSTRLHLSVEVATLLLLSQSLLP